MIKEENIILNLKCKNYVDALRSTAELLKKNGSVKDSFEDAVLERENVYPTGIEIGEVGVALPHTEAEHIIENAIAVVVLEEPVEFHMMGFPEKLVDVKIIIMLAMSKSDGHLEALQKISIILQDEEKLVAIKNAQTENEVFELFKNVFK